MESPWASDDRNETSYDSNVSCSVCVRMHVYVIPPSNVQPFDIVLLIPNVVFLSYLLIKCRPTAKKLAGSLTLFKILYAVTFLIPVTGIMYAVISMILSRNDPIAKVFNIICRSSVLLTELNVILFGVFFKFYNHLRLRLAISIIFIVGASLVNAGIQLTFVFVKTRNESASNCNFVTSLYGTMYGFILSVIFAILYCAIFFLYLTKLYTRWDLPSKKSFYRYTFCLMVLNIAQAVGNMLLYLEDKNRIDNYQMAGLCITTIATILYYTSVAPMIYWIFLSNYFRMNPPKPILVDGGPSAEDINISGRSSFNKGSSSVAKSSITKSSCINKGPSINNVPSLMKRADSKGGMGSAKLYCQEQAALLNDNDSISSFGSIDEDEGVKMNVTKVST